MIQKLVESTPQGLYCPAGDFHIDPSRRVERAVVTHAHADHARPGSRRYLTTRAGLGLLRTRLGEKPVIDTVEYGETVVMNGVRVSLHPAGHLLGSAQVRVEKDGFVAVVSGDYKLEADPTCAAFEPVRCHYFISEATFGMPVYCWPAAEGVFDEIHGWWRANQSRRLSSVILCYALGKAQRLLAGLDAGIGPIFVHPDIEPLNEQYEAAGVRLARRQPFEAGTLRAGQGRALILAPPSADGSRWLARFGPNETAMASGWMLRPQRWQRASLHAGFVLSDHADYNGLMKAIAASGADTIGVMHGFVDEMVSELHGRGCNAHAVASSHDRRKKPAQLELFSMNGPLIDKPS